ncbi:hypothetical protein PsYK624_011130 [Phanerochaete sordida]|uniref:Uncharacterized protein n=1 Tax=Phanerochaete sordida TaxID=48140 RepID=A0A9P3FYS3_9APHY|nr:hypothetical protein PsYK624_011130 [Phanerochaete sordida]
MSPLKPPNPLMIIGDEGARSQSRRLRTNATQKRSDARQKPWTRGRISQCHDISVLIFVQPPSRGARDGAQLFVVEALQLYSAEVRLRKNCLKRGRNGRHRHAGRYSYLDTSTKILYGNDHMALD